MLKQISYNFSKNATVNLFESNLEIDFLTSELVNTLVCVNYLWGSIVIIADRPNLYGKETMETYFFLEKKKEIMQGCYLK